MLSDSERSVRACDLVRSLVPMDAGVALPEHGEGRLVRGARRTGPATERLDDVEVVPRTWRLSSDSRRHHG